VASNGFRTSISICPVSEEPILAIVATPKWMTPVADPFSTAGGEIAEAGAKDKDRVTGSDDRLPRSAELPNVLLAMAKTEGEP
jgi:hypothetical protein